MLTDHRCTKYTDCSSCSFYQRDIFKYRLYPKGYVIPQTRCMQNMVFFLVKGEIWLNSEEHPDTTFRGGQFVLQPIGSKVECKALEPIHSRNIIKMQIIDNQILFEVHSKSKSF